MNFLGYGLILLIAAAVVTGAVVCKTKQKDFNKIYKVFALVLGGVHAFRVLWGRVSISNVSNLIVPDPFLTTIGAFTLWFGFAAAMLFILAAFFKIKTWENLIKYFVLPYSVFALIFAFNTFEKIAGTLAINAHSIIYAVEVALLLGGSVAYALIKRNFKITKKETANMLIALAAMLVASIPAYFFKIFVPTEYNKSFSNLDPGHRVLMYFAVIIPTVMYFGLRKKSPVVIKASLTFFSLVTLVTFSHRAIFASFLDPTALPFHLCNTAMYIIPLCLIFNMKRLFYFTLFINVLGALIAIVITPEATTFLSSAGNFSFWVNHWCAFFMPFLIVALKVFPRPKFNQFKWSMIGFGVYFIIAIIFNAWFSNYGEVDFFYLNSDYVVSKLGLWAEATRNVIFSFKLGGLTFTFYPVYQTLFFAVYVVAGFGVWFVYEYAYKIADYQFETHARFKKIRLEELAFKREHGLNVKSEPVNKKGVNMVRLINFSKRYGTSDVYAVKNVNLEIKTGEVFGFLGPNGAGKSTIIKSIVGIQPISEGNIEVCGFDVEKQSIEAKMNIGFVPDHYALYEKLTGREYINYIADLYLVSQKDRDERISHFLKIFELNLAFDNQMKTYSHGMKQKIAIIAALIHNPKVWILDEPLTGLDPNSIYQVKETMKAHAKAGNIVFFSSHIIDVVEKICDRIAIIEKGTILAQKKVSELDKAGVSLEDFYISTISAKPTKLNLNDYKINKGKKQ